MSYPCVLQNSETKGNYVIATKAIKSGDVIIQSETPFVWNSVTCFAGQHFHKFCNECGIVLRNQMYDEIRSDLMRNNSFVDETMVSTMTALIPLASLSPDQIGCSRGCDAVFCSEECHSLASAHGHEWLCESFQTPNNRHQQLKALDNKGHHGLACKVYAQVAAETLRRVVLDPSIDVAAEAVAVAEGLLAEYQPMDFALTMHAHRTGRFEVDPGMFDSLIFPAYFGAHLAAPLALCKEIFQQSGPVLWSGDGGSVPTAVGTQRSEAFLLSAIFSDQFYSRLIGTFVINCLSVHVSSPLDYILSEALAVQSGAEGRNVSQEFDPLVVDRVVEYLQGRLRAQRDSAYTADADEEQEEEHDSAPAPSSVDDQAPAAGPAGAPVARFLGMSASGLFSRFSKGNHSCVCNTTNFGSDRVSVTVVATEDIAPGAEVTNCYIHHDSLNLNDGGRGHDNHYHMDTACASSNIQHVLNSQLTKKQRHRALRQYVFECDCPLCASQEVDSDEESD